MYINAWLTYSNCPTQSGRRVYLFQFLGCVNTLVKIGMKLEFSHKLILRLYLLSFLLLQGSNYSIELFNQMIDINCQNIDVKLSKITIVETFEKSSFLSEVLLYYIQSIRRIFLSSMYVIRYSLFVIIIIIIIRAKFLCNDY